MFSASLLSCDTFVWKNYSWMDTPLLVLAQSTLEDNTLTIQSVALQMLLTERAATVKYGSARVCPLLLSYPSLLLQQSWLHLTMCSLGPASLQHGTSSPTSAVSSKDCAAECSLCLGRSQSCKRRCNWLSSALSSRRPRAFPGPGWGLWAGADTCPKMGKHKDKVHQPALSLKLPFYLRGTNGWDLEAALSCPVCVSRCIEGQIGL